MEGKKKSFVATVKEHLSLPGEGVTDLFAQIKQLTPADRESLYKDFQAAGIECEPPGAATQAK